MKMNDKEQKRIYQLRYNISDMLRCSNREDLISQIIRMIEYKNKRIIKLQKILKNTN